jgi:hypothetical protein
MPCGFDHRKQKVVPMADEAMAPYVQAAGLTTQRGLLMEMFTEAARRAPSWGEPARD